MTHARRIRSTRTLVWAAMAVWCAGAGAVGVAQAAQTPQAQQTAPAPAPAAPAASASSTLAIAGDVATPLSISAADLKTFPRTKVESKDEGRTVVYEGVLVGELLKRAGAPLGNDLRGNAIASYVLARASDGYQVVFSLAEIDPAFTSNDIIVADTIDGKPRGGVTFSNAMGGGASR